MKAKSVFLSLAVALLLFSGCGSESPEPVTEKAEAAPSAVVSTPSPTDTPTVILPDGTQVNADAVSVDLSSLTDKDIDAAVDALEGLPSLQMIYLGTERDTLSWDSVSRIVSSRGSADIDFVFKIYGKEARLADTRLDLSHIEVGDSGEIVRTVCPLMYSLRSLDMDSCGVPDGEMELIRQLLPDCEVNWRIWFGDTLMYSVRTDAERILASMPSQSCILAPGTYDNLKYCTKVRFMDIGLNSLVDDISFASSMPELEVLIITKNSVSDISPLASCKKLEYLEIANNLITNLSPLGGLDSLRHVNFCNNPGLADISPLFGLTGLERIWIGGNNNVSPEQVQELLKAVPDAAVDNSCNEYYEHWFYDWDRYWKVKEQFGNYEFEAYSFEINAKNATADNQ